MTRCCRLGSVQGTDLPECVVRSLADLSTLVCHLDVRGLAHWASSEEGPAYLSIYLCAVLACMTLYKSVRPT
jgi:hypothetical protein